MECSKHDHWPKRSPFNVVLDKKRAVTTSEVRGSSKAFLPIPVARKKAGLWGRLGGEVG